MDKIDYSIPFEVKGINSKQVPYGMNMKLVTVEFNTMILWEDVIGLETFIENWNFPEETRDMCVIVVARRGAYTILENYEDFKLRWMAYRQATARFNNIIKSN